MDVNKNHVKEEDDDLSFFDKFNDSNRDEIFPKFMSQSPVDFSELEQYTDDEMSSILKQEMDDSVVVHVPHKSLTSSIMEVTSNFKKPRKKKSKSTLKDLAILNPRRSKRLTLKRAAGTKSENMKRVEEYMMEEKSLRAQARARAVESAMLETETKDLSDGNTDLKENQIHQLDVKNGNIKLGIQWLKQMASNPTIANIPFPFNVGNYADLLPNLKGQGHSAEALVGFAGASSSAARGDDALPRCMIDGDHSPDNSLENNGLTEGSNKPLDLALTD